jgi:hypothetical protein
MNFIVKKESFYLYLYIFFEYQSFFHIIETLLTTNKLKQVKKKRLNNYEIVKI